MYIWLFHKVYPYGEVEKIKHMLPCKLAKL